MVTPHLTLQQLSRLLDVLQQRGVINLFGAAVGNELLKNIETTVGSRQSPSKGNVRETLARANIVVTDLGLPDEFEGMSRGEAAIEVVKRLGLGRFLISNAEPQQIVDNVAAIVQKYFIEDCGKL